MDVDGLDVKIQECEVEKDLGVSFDGNLKFNQHIESVVNKANKLVGIMKRTYKYLDKESFLLLYKSLIRPHLEYANVIWSPIFKYQSITIERVQRRATKILAETKGMSYEQRLKYLQLPSLKYRRLRGDMIQMFKIIKEIDDVDPDNFFEKSSFEKTRNSAEKVSLRFTKSNIKKHCFSVRAAQNWNTKLTPLTKLTDDLNTFKELLDGECFLWKISTSLTSTETES